MKKMKAKPDDRSDNVEKLQEKVQNTIENMEESEQYLNEFGDEISDTAREQISDKNKRRRESIKGFREEIKDEANEEL